MMPIDKVRRTWFCFTVPIYLLSPPCLSCTRYSHVIVGQQDQILQQPCDLIKLNTSQTKRRRFAQHLRPAALSTDRTKKSTQPRQNFRSIMSSNQADQPKSIRRVLKTASDKVKTKLQRSQTFDRFTDFPIEIQEFVILHAIPHFTPSIDIAYKHKCGSNHGKGSFRWKVKKIPKAALNLQLVSRGVQVIARRCMLQRCSGFVPINFPYRLRLLNLPTWTLQTY